MNRHPKTSRYFLEHLVPRSALDGPRLERLQAVLRGSAPAAERELAFELAEFLADAGRFDRLDDGRYRDPLGGRTYRFLAAPVPEASQPAPSEEPPDAAPVAASAPAIEVREGVAPGHLFEILAVLRLQGRQPGLMAGIARLLAMLERWYPGSQHTLYHVESLEGAGNSERPDAMRELAPETLPEAHPYRLALTAPDGVLLDAQDASHGWYPPRQSAREGHWLLQPLRDELDPPGGAWGLLELHLPWEEDLDRARADLGAIGQGLSHLLHNHRVLADVVYVDGLTRVFNRQFLTLQLPLEIERAARNNEPLAVLVADLDDFKQINDTYGHTAGDQVLREFGSVIKETLRRVDMVFRFGGEEFVVLLPRLDEDSALRAAERLREAVAGHSYRLGEDGPSLEVTASIGGAIYPRDALSEESLFRTADEACYRAKRSGKNRVVFAHSGSDAETPPAADLP